MMENKFFCVDCDKTPKNGTDYNRHRKRHDRPYKCSLCPRSFGLNSDRKRHMAGHQKSPFKFTCPSPGCDSKGMSRKEHVLRHLQRFHRQGAEDCRIQINHNEIKEKESRDRAAQLDVELLGAAYQGDVESINELISGGGDIAVTDKNGQTLLHLGSGAGHEAMVKLLLEKGAKVDTNDSDCLTPLRAAAENGHEAVAKLLLENGAAINASGRWKTPLYGAADNGHEAMVKLLLEKGAEVDTNDSDRWTPLRAATENGHEAVVKLLLEKAATINPSDRGNRPLSLAAEHGHEAIVHLLLENGTEIDAKGLSGRTPLYMATKNGHKVIVQLLLEKGADINARDRYNMTPLV